MLYLTNEVLLLTDIFQIYIDECKSAYGIIILFPIVRQVSHGKLVQKTLAFT